MRSDYDVAVIGAGAAGAAASWRLAQRGLSVLCLEQGDWVKPAHSPSKDADWELKRLREWHPNPNVRKAPIDYPIDDTESCIRPLLFNGVGGSTVMWSCHLPRFHAHDFSMHSDDGVGDDWPITLNDLLPYYRINESMMGVAGLAGNPGYHTNNRPNYSTPPAPFGPAEKMMAQTFDQLGWQWWPADLAIHTGANQSDRQSCNHCGPCELHCSRRAKAGADVRYWPAALSLGAELRTGARVSTIETDANQRVQQVVYQDRQHNVRTINTRTVFVAANGIGTPRLLLLSANRQQPQGLGNRSGLVGKRLMLHPLARVTGRFTAPMDSYRGITAGTFVSHHFNLTDKHRGFVRGIKLQLLRSPGPALSALSGAAGRLQWGVNHHQDFAQWFNHSVSLSICTDDLPSVENRIELDEQHTDSDGLPGVKLIYTVGDNTRKALEFGIDQAVVAMSAAGAVETRTMNVVADAGFHLMGTCRMGDDPEHSVLNRWCESHDVAGLFVIDGSAFVTAAAVNPTNTLQALALRASDHLVDTRKQR